MVVGMATQFRPGWALSISLFYLVALYFIAGIHWVNLLFVGAVLLLYFLHAQTRLFLLLGFPYVIHSILYDSVRFFPKNWFGPLHIQDVYNWDLNWFGVTWAGKKILLCDFLNLWAGPMFDTLAGMVYFFHEPGLLILCLIFFFCKRYELFHRVGVCFLLMNLMAILTHIFFPVAPPWYVDQHGFNLPAMQVLGDAAGLSRFDTLLGLKFYQDLYKYNPIVFGAIPSMHAGVTLLTVIFAYRYKRFWLWPSLGYFLIMIWAAVYLRHHYVVDILIGMLYCGVAVWIGERLAKRPWRAMALLNAGEPFYQLHR